MTRKQWAAWMRLKKRAKSKAAHPPNETPHEVVISNDDMRKVTWAWLYADVSQQRRQRLCWLMLLYSNPNVKDLARKLEITPKELLAALVELQNLP